MDDRYYDVPGIGDVIVSRHAQERAGKDGISEDVFTSVLYKGQHLAEGQDIVWRTGKGIRIVITLDPGPTFDCPLIKTAFRVLPPASIRRYRG